MELKQYIKPDGTFDYELYKQVQTEGNKRKIDHVWVLEKNIAFLSNYIKSAVGRPKFGICHGTRKGKEQEWFRKYLGCEVIGTEISDTAEQFPHTIQWDFHETRPEWINAVDFIYSNSLDHSYDPDKCLNAWMSCVKEDGICIIEHTSKHEHATQLDPFGAHITQMPDLISKWGKGHFYVQKIIEAPEKPDVVEYLYYIIIKRSPLKNKKKEQRKIFIDCGAYTGNSVKKFLSAFDGFEIFSFEPNPHLHHHHQGLSSTLIPKAVWIREGWIDFYLDQKDFDGSSVYEHKINIVDKAKITVPTIDFSRWLNDHFSKDDFIILKMDIEGAEYEVLNKMIADGTIEYIDELMIEFHGHKIGLDPRQHDALLRRLGDYNIVPVKWDAISWDRPNRVNSDLMYLTAKYPALTKSDPAESVSAGRTVKPAASEQAGLTREYIDANVTVVIRSVGERTEALCCERLSSQVASANIHIVRKSPFTEAVRETFRVGLQENRKWTLAVDADVVLAPNAVEKLIAFAEAAGEDVFTIIGPLADKFLVSPRPVGYHLYPTRRLIQALDFIPDPLDAIRPETFVRDKMVELGLSCVKADFVAGHHDFEQYYRDIYRKCFVHAKKHYEMVLKVLANWRRLAQTDTDFLVAIAGFNDGVQYGGTASIDVNAPFMEAFEHAMKRLSLSEKAPLTTDSKTASAAVHRSEPVPLRVCLLYDYVGWAWHHRAEAIQRHIQNPDIRIEIAPAQEAWKYKDADFVVSFGPYNLADMADIPPSRRVVGSSNPYTVRPLEKIVHSGLACAGIVNSLWQYNYLASRENMFYMPNGVDTDLFYPAEQMPSEFSACWVGNAGAFNDKGLEIIQPALQKAGIRLHGCNFSSTKSAGAALTHSQLRERIYHKSAFYVCMSRFEGTPNPALEALACGLPVISTPVGNMPEIIKDGYNGFLIERSEESLMAAVEKLRQADWRAMSRNARQSVLDGWRWADQAKRYEHLFLTLRQARRSKTVCAAAGLTDDRLPTQRNVLEALTKELAELRKQEKQNLDYEWKLRPSAGLSGTKRADSPCVSILMSVFNGSRFVRQALESMYRQTYQDFEVIIVDDASTDDTPDILRQLKDERTRVIRNEVNLGLTRSLNIGLRHCRGRYIARMDADDLSAPARLEKQVQFLDAHPGCLVVGTWCSRIDAEGAVVGKWTPRTEADEIRSRLMSGSMLPHGSAMLRRTALLDAGGYNESYGFAQDYDLWLRLSEKGEIRNLPECLYFLRVWEGTISVQKKAEQQSFAERARREALCRRQQSLPKTASAESASVLGNAPEEKPDALKLFRNAQAAFGRGEFAAANQLIDRYRRCVNYDRFKVSRPHPKTSAPLFSVIIVTYNRPADAETCIKTLRGQSFRDYEIIVVDNGTNRAVQAARLADVAVECPINFNLSEGRNIGAHFARGRILVLLDDDAIPGENYLKSVYQAFADYDICGLRGRAFAKNPHPDLPPPPVYDLGEEPFAVLCSQEGNAAFRRDVWQRLGGMDPLLFGMEGSDLSYRILQSCSALDKVMYWPHTRIYHDFGDPGKRQAKRDQNQFNRQYLRLKHGVDMIDFNTRLKKRRLVPKQPGMLPSAPNAAQCGSGQTAMNAVSPKVSIVLACRNEEEFLAECLDSILAQTLTEWELLVADDGSDDRTRDILKSYAEKDSRIRLWFFDDQQGPYVRRNFAIGQSHAPFICVHDADDIMTPHKLATLYTHISGDPRLGAVGSWYRRFLDIIPAPDFGDCMEFPTQHDQIIQSVLAGVEWCSHGSAIIRRTLFEQIGLYDEHPWNSDSFWLAKAGLFSYLTGRVRLMNIPDCLTLVRKRQSSQTIRINPADPRGRRLRFRLYFRDKLFKIVERCQKNPNLDAAEMLRDCSIRDFNEKFGHLFEQWENAPVTDEMLEKTAGRTREEFEGGRFISALLRLDLLKQMNAEIDRRIPDFHLIGALALYGAGHDVQVAGMLDRLPDDQKHLFRFDLSIADAAKRKRQVLDFYRSRYAVPSAPPESPVAEAARPQSITAVAGGSPVPVRTPNVNIIKSSSQPKVAIVLACHNEETWLAECLDSILAQTLADWELLVVDDGSTDRTREIVKAYAARDTRLRLWFFDDQKGPYVRRNFAIAQSRAPFISIQDADDIMLPEKMALLHQHISSDDRLGIVGSWFRKFLDYIPGIEYGDCVIKRLMHEDIMEVFLSTLHLCWHGSAIVRKTLFDRVGLYPENPWGSDSFWLAKAGMYGYLTGCVRFMNLPGCLTLKREHQDSQTGRISPIDPRSRRHLVTAHYRKLLYRIGDQYRQNPNIDVARLLRDCSVQDFIDSGGQLFDASESAPVTEPIRQYMLRLIQTGFEGGSFVSSLMNQNLLERMDSEITLKCPNFRLVKALSLYAAGHDGQTAQEIERLPLDQKSRFAFDFSVKDAFERKRRVLAVYKTLHTAAPTKTSDSDVLEAQKNRADRLRETIRQAASSPMSPAAK